MLASIDRTAERSSTTGSSARATSAICRRRIRPYALIRSIRQRALGITLAKVNPVTRESIPTRRARRRRPLTQLLKSPASPSTNRICP